MYNNTALLFASTEDETEARRMHRDAAVLAVVRVAAACIQEQLRRKLGWLLVESAHVAEANRAVYLHQQSFGVVALHEFNFLALSVLFVTETNMRG